MIQNNYTPAFPLKHQQKDMRLALALGDENAVSMPVAAAANEVRDFFGHLISGGQFRLHFCSAFSLLRITLNIELLDAVEKT